MPSIYDIKPRFQALLRPLANKLANDRITANQVTVFACIVSVITGILLLCFVSERLIFWIVPVILLFRMALNAIDGLLAKEHDMKTPQGCLLNELTDMISDTAIYLPFALLSPLNPLWVFAIVILSLMTEAAGLATIQIGASRRYDGPMGKSDRAFAFSVIAILLALGAPVETWLDAVWGIMIILLILTIINRCKKALREINA